MAMPSSAWNFRKSGKREKVGNVMKRIICFLSIILLLCSSSAASLAENTPLSLHEAYHLMDTFESREYESVWEKKTLEKENTQHTRKWEKELMVKMRRKAERQQQNRFQYFIIFTFFLMPSAFSYIPG